MRIADVIICGNALNFTLKLLLLQEDGDGNVNYEEFVTIMFKVRNNFRQSSVEDISLCLAETRVKSADWKDVPTPNGQQCINYKKLSIGSCHPTVSLEVILPIVPVVKTIVGTHLSSRNFFRILFREKIELLSKHLRKFSLDDI